MNPVYAIVVVMLFIALGEIVSIWSKARVPSLLIAMLGIFIVAKAGWVPESLVDDTGLLSLYTIMSAPLLFHMGSIIPLRTLAKQWRSVLITCGGMAIAVGVMALVIWPLFGFQTFVAGSGPLAGGIVATGLTTAGLKEHAVAGAVLVLPSLVLMLQSVPSMPMTNFLLRRHAIRLRDSGELEQLAAAHKADEEMAATKKKLVNLPKALTDNELFMLFIIFCGGALAVAISGPTHIPSSIVALILGIICTWLGLTPDRAMERASSFGLGMASIIAVVVAPLMAASIPDILHAIVPLIAILIIGGLGIMLGGYIVTKLLKWKGSLGMSVALTAMYGFPADYLITNEVARGVARSEEEKESLLAVMLPPMLVGGFTSVSAGSVVIASVLVAFL
ncbi:hypothetical protein NQ038_13740 [Brevibacterium sp. 50QC2O2]|uniref:hypothetical protein n=1 Tax=Brevibacterium TaxID=1696 RepID=UPI00211C7C2B|nr:MULTISPECIES: hypothetical protein [unclassified Brevibacterium]MCQ9369368.1 hypothetical protein [Brevibacterium sp. 91QC2O2]MCQ9386721.1 hypothetical protein [Brevibacterium sp. 68QC2CO]MCQ9389697.1 hypothetical protein [Brevibacterium sp. 50QC2O2]